MNPVLRPYLFHEDIYQVPEKTTVVVKRPWENYTTAEKALLEKILSSVRLSVNAVRVISSPRFTPESITNAGHTRLLIFGSQTEGLTPYQVTAAQGFTIVWADDLSELDDTKKKNLWLGLKSMFGV